MGISLSLTSGHLESNEESVALRLAYNSSLFIYFSL